MLRKLDRPSTIIAAAVALWCAIATCAMTAAHAQQTRYYAPNSSSLGTSTRSGNTENFYGAGGSKTGSATTDSQGTTTFYDSRGNVVAKSSAPRMRVK